MRFVIDGGTHHDGARHRARSAARSYAKASGEELRVLALPPSAGTLQFDVVWRDDNESELLECDRKEVLANWIMGEQV